ncbi:MAG: GNAT family N-acetyltransferase [Candidatus Shapirobacteria bacterium]|nr:GNAT family N-acetyltransferase [Candidatus Shapirobacteria bacterium]
MTIISPQLSDLDQIIPLWHQDTIFHADLDPKYYIEYDESSDENDRIYLTNAITQGQPQISVAKINEKVVGLITYETGKPSYQDTILDNFGEILELFVDPNYRSQGIAKELMAYAENYFKKSGLKYMKLAVSAFNAYAIGLYQKLGYIDRQHLMFKQL